MTTATSITVRVQLKIRRRPGRKTVVTPVWGSEAAVATRADPALLKALARAFRYQRLLDEGRYSSVSELAAAERLERGYVGTLLRLTLLAPDIVPGILDGRQPEPGNESLWERSHDRLRQLSAASRISSLRPLGARSSGTGYTPDHVAHIIRH